MHGPIGGPGSSWGPLKCLEKEGFGGSGMGGGEVRRTSKGRRSASKGRKSEATTADVKCCCSYGGNIPYSEKHMICVLHYDTATGAVIKRQFPNRLPINYPEERQRSPQSNDRNLQPTITNKFSLVASLRSSPPITSLSRRVQQPLAHDFLQF